MYYAAATFCDSNTLEYWNCGAACKQLPGVTDVNIVYEILMGTFGYVAYNTQTNNIIVAIRGSWDVANWVSDLDYFLKPYPDGPQGAMVHVGFYDAYLSLEGQIISSVKNLL